MKTISATELKKNLGLYLDAVKEKEEVYITKNNKKIAKLAPIYSDLENYFNAKEEAITYGELKVSLEEFKEISNKSDSRLEYLNGQIFQMASPSIKHQAIVGQIYYALTTGLKNHICKAFVAPCDVYFLKHMTKVPDVLQPDIFVACDLEEHVNENSYTGLPTIVVEVLSPSTRNRDAVYKLNTYMLSGVQEYWIVDPEDQQIMIYTFENYIMKHVRIFKSGIIKSVLGIEILFEEIL
ncbi:MAG: type II toxin-antitoxin system Phd/YefM family antitoxin [Clostridia bacterium]|nr:type II toxin-antitoxin system Phd/YefM family antitoxin [Clostridia bacterium]